jgi:hypothetical protein
MTTLRYFKIWAVFSGAVLVTAMAVQDCRAAFNYFDGSTSSDFLDGTNWTPATAPGSNLVDTYSIDDGRTAELATGTTTINGLRVGSAAKEHAAGEIHSGRLDLTGGTLQVIGSNLLSIGRENQSFYPIGGDYNKDTFVDAVDYTVWRNTFGSNSDLSADGNNNGQIDAGDYDFWKMRYGNKVRGGEIVMTADSVLRSNGALVGERTRGLLSIGPDAAVEIRIWDTAVMPAQFGGTEDIRIGGYGPVFDIFGSEPGLDGNGLVHVEGLLNVKDMYLSEHGARGELRVDGGEVNLNGELFMDFCGGCGTDPQLLALRSAKVTLIGSDGTFNVGLDPDPMVIDPLATNRNLNANSSTATFTFLADAGGVTPIVIAENPGETSGTAFINLSNLVVNLDAYASASPLTLINAPAGNLVGTFGSVTFAGTRTATVEYDVISGDVRLMNFVGGAGSGGIAGGVVPEPASVMLLLTAFAFAGGLRRQRPGLRG